MHKPYIVHLMVKRDNGHFGLQIKHFKHVDNVNL